MAFKKRLEFGNFTLTFGSKKVLLDLFEEVFMPSFHEMKHIRKLKGKGEYFFIDTEVLKLGVDENSDPVFGLFGRIVKNTKITREQIFNSVTGLVPDKDELETAPSSVFLLVLNNHRLIFCKEVPGAPTIGNFESTCSLFLRKSHTSFIKGLVQQNKDDMEQNGAKRITKKAFVEENPFPTLRITPLSDKETLKTFVDRFQKLEKVSIKLLPTNNEDINLDDFWQGVDQTGQKIKSKNTTLGFSNNEGLDKSVAYDQTQSASALANSAIKFSGYDEDGDTLRGNNEDFNLTVVDDVPSNSERASNSLFGEFKRLVGTGTITLPVVARDTVDKLTRLFNGT